MFDFYLFLLYSIFIVHSNLLRLLKETKRSSIQNKSTETETEPVVPYKYWYAIVDTDMYLLLPLTCRFWYFANRQTKSSIIPVSHWDNKQMSWGLNNVEQDSPAHAFCYNLATSWIFQFIKLPFFSAVCCFMLKTLPL